MSSFKNLNPQKSFMWNSRFPLKKRFIRYTGKGLSRVTVTPAHVLYWFLQEKSKTIFSLCRGDNAWTISALSIAQVYQLFGRGKETSKIILAKYWCTWTSSWNQKSYWGKFAPKFICRWFQKLVQFFHDIFSILINRTALEKTNGFKKNSFDWLRADFTAF